MKRALICGISGQDGSYLAKFLLEKGYEVHGTSRDAQMASFDNLKRLGIRNDVQLSSLALNDFGSVLQTLRRVRPDEVYNLAGQSSVSLSFQQPIQTLESIAIGSLYLLETVRLLEAPTRLYNACSSECFGDTGDKVADETTPFRPRSPYAVAKATSYWEVANYREAYGLFACSGLLFNHESPLRPERFVTRKIVSSAVRISRGSNEKLELGDISIIRDWGWAPEYVRAMWMMLQRQIAKDYIVATGKSYSLQTFVEIVFELLGLDWRKHVTSHQSFFRPTDIAASRADPRKANQELDWRATCDMKDVARLMVEAEL